MDPLKGHVLPPPPPPPILDMKSDCTYTFSFMQHDADLSTLTIKFGSETQDFEHNLKVSLQSHQISLFHKNISRFQAKSLYSHKFFLLTLTWFLVCFFVWQK